jgi:predicted nucleic acid-binding protein
MKVIVDTNIIFGAFLRSNNRYLQHLLFSDADFYSMRFVIVELFKHKERIVKHSQLPEEQILDFLHQILSKIQFMDERLISIASYATAHRLCFDVDIKDLPFVALSIELDAQLWTIDKKLMEGIASKGFINFHTVA